MDWIRKGAFLGIVFFIAILIIKPIGVSTQFSVVSGVINHVFNPDIITKDESSEYGLSSSNEYYNKDGGKLANSINNPWGYDFVFVLAIPIGACIGTKIKKNNQDERKYKNSCKKVSFKTYIPSFISGFLLLYGARLADGCTSGHMMSGIMQGSISGYVFAICAFAVAIPTAILISKCHRERGEL